MYHRNTVRQSQPWAEEPFWVLDADAAVEPGGPFSELDPSVVLDAFDADHEMQEPEPEHGDFWSEPEEALI